MDRRRFLGLLSALAVAGSAVARSPDDAGALLIQIDIPGPHLLPFIPLELIPRLGIDRVLGAQLVIRHTPSGVQALERVVVGDADFAAVGFSVLPRFVSKGKPVVALASLSSGMPPYVVLVRNALADEVKGLADLKGRSIGVPLGSETAKSYPRTLLELWLAGHGVAANEVRWVPTNMNFDGMFGALASGAVDAVFCEDTLSRTLLRHGHGRLLASLTDAEQRREMPAQGHLRAVIASTPKIIEAEPRRARLLLQMLRRSMAWIKQHSAEEIVAELNIQDRDWANDLTLALTQLPQTYSQDVGFSETEIQASLRYLKETGTSLPAGFDIHQLIDNRWSGDLQ